MSNIATLLPPMKKGEPRRCGRAPGQTNRVTRALKIALITAAEKSRHSDGSLERYCIFLADEHPPVFAALLGKLIPVQAKVKADGFVPRELTMNMPLSEMISNFEMKIKSDYQPPEPVLIEHDDDDDDDDEPDA